MPLDAMGCSSIRFLLMHTSFTAPVFANGFVCRAAAVGWRHPSCRHVVERSRRFAVPEQDRRQPRGGRDGAGAAQPQAAVRRRHAAESRCGGARLPA
jgi:hypothetical protein